MPIFSEARAFQTRMFISMEPESRYLLSSDQRTTDTRCIRFVWYTSLLQAWQNQLHILL